MPLSKDQISTLLSLVAKSTPDDISCDGCLEHVAQFVETELAGAEMCDTMKLIQNPHEELPVLHGRIQRTVGSHGCD